MRTVSFTEYTDAAPHETTGAIGGSTNDEEPRKLAAGSEGNALEFTYTVDVDMSGGQFVLEVPRDTSRFGRWTVSRKSMQIQFDGPTTLIYQND